MKTRFCPSPTGYLHIGNIRTALFNYLAAKSLHGDYLLRMEDTDTVRSKDVYVNNIIDDLNWLGLEWDEGITKDNSDNYFQSNRKDIYDQYIDKLLQNSDAYLCFCTEERLQKLKDKQIKEAKPPRYDGKCRNINKESLKDNIEKGLKPVVRF